MLYTKCRVIFNPLLAIRHLTLKRCCRIGNYKLTWWPTRVLCGRLDGSQPSNSRYVDRKCKRREPLSAVFVSADQALLPCYFDPPTDLFSPRQVLAGGLGLGAGNLGAGFGRLDYLLRDKGQASRFIYVWHGPYKLHMQRLLVGCPNCVDVASVRSRILRDE